MTQIIFKHIRAGELLPRLAAILIAALALFATPPAPAQAAHFTVTKTADTADGACNADCSLREAIETANSTPGRDRITIPAGTYALALDQLYIKDDLTIQGAGADATIIDGAGASRIMGILSGDIRISDVAIQNGNSNEGSGIDNLGGRLRLHQSAVRNNRAGEDGAAIRNHGWLSITSSVISGNSAETGGALFNTGTATIVQSTLVDNAAANWGGAIRNDGKLDVRQTEILRNQTGPDGRGGAIYNGEGTIKLYLVTIAQNNANSGAGEGGGIYNNDTATLTIDRGDVNDNRAPLGGGIRNLGTLTLRRSGVTGNAAHYGGGIHNAGKLSVDRGDIHDNRATFFTGGGVHNAGSLAMKASSIHNNASSEDGGGLFNQGTAELVDTSLRDNEAIDGTGGGIDNRGTLTMRGGSVSDNTSRGLDRGGGGIDNRGTIVLRGVEISGNATNQSGGGMYTSGVANLDRVTVAQNSANLERDDQGNGGGVFNSGTITLTHSAVISNTVLRFGQGGGVAYTGYGGGLFTAGSGAATITNTTFSGNHAEESGGGIASQGATVKLSFVTVTNNRADSDDDESGVGGGIFNDRLTVVPGPFTLKGTIVAGNRDLTGDGPDCWGPFVSGAHNLIQNPFDCTFTGDTSSDIVGQDARLGPLADNGGPTLTHALLADSSVIDAIDRAACTDVDGQRVRDDQRGVRRPQAAACDIGAFERK